MIPTVGRRTACDPAPKWSRVATRLDHQVASLSSLLRPGARSTSLP